MEEESIGKSNGTIKEVSNDAQGFDWETGEQQTASKYLRPAKLPESEAKAKKYLKSTDQLIDIKPVKRLGTIEVRKPKRQEWFRSHPNPEMFREMFVIKKDSTGDFYAVDPDIAAELGDEVSEAYVTAAINDEGALFLWPILKPKADGNGAQLFDNDLDNLSLSRNVWIRRQWEGGRKSYKVEETTTEKQPAWPENCNLGDWMEKAFKHRFIDDVDHPLLRRLRGEL